MSKLDPNTKGFFAEVFEPQSEGPKKVSNASPSIGQVALLGLLYCIKGKGGKKRCFGHPIAASSKDGKSGARELGRWVRTKGNTRYIGNPNQICEVTLISRTRKGGKKVFGTVKRCYSAPEGMNMSDVISEME